MVDTDFQIGAIVQLSVYSFQLLKADDFTINYMRERPDKFPDVNLESIIGKVKTLSKNFKTYD
jgi:EF-hand domain-containing protein 1